MDCTVHVANRVSFVPCSFEGMMIRAMTGVVAFSLSLASLLVSCGCSRPKSDETRPAAGSGFRLALKSKLDGDPTMLTLKGHHYDVNSVRFSPDGKRIVSGGRDKTIKAWNISSLD